MRKFPTCRRTLFRVLALTLGGAPVAWPAAAQQPSPAVARDTPAEAPRELTADQQVRHALSRLAFGPRPGDAERVRAMGVDRWIAQQLEPSRIDDRETERFLSRFATLAMTTEELLREYPPRQVLRAQQRAGMGPEDSAAVRRAARQSQRILAELQTAKVARAVASERQLEEVMVDFWENHFSIFAGKGPERYLLGAFDRDAIRPHALGRFRDLLGATARSPAMLFYLDNWQSAAEPGRPRLDGARGSGLGARPGRARAPSPEPRAPQQRPPRGLNENYARELLELHTLGVDGGYTQEDVVNVARAFTGWTLEGGRRNPTFAFRPQMHDAGEKVVLARRLAAGRGLEDGEEVLDILARHPSTARFIASKLARRFVSDSPPPALVERAAATFRRTDGDIREVVRTIVTSPEFFSRRSYRSKVKSPFELVASALRAVNAAPDSTPRTAQLVARLGQPLFLHQAPNGYPETGEAWINTGAILNRINFGLALAAGRVPGASIERWPEGARLAGAPRAEQVNGVILALLGGEASVDTRKVLESGVNPLLGQPGPGNENQGPAMGPGKQRDSATNAEPPSGEDEMMAPGDRPRGRARRDALGGPLRLKGLAQIVGLALGSPEFQRR